VKSITASGGNKVNLVNLTQHKSRRIKVFKEDFLTEYCDNGHGLITSATGCNNELTRKYYRVNRTLDWCAIFYVMTRSLKRRKLGPLVRYIRVVAH
jgi:hypothetical protein